MHESSVIQHFLPQGIEQGTRESLVESILENLEVRFQLPNSQAVHTLLERIETLHRLRQLRRESLQVQSLNAFRQILAQNTNASDSSL